jgi:hypothetical protein
VSGFRPEKVLLQCLKAFVVVTVLMPWLQEHNVQILGAHNTQRKLSTMQYSAKNVKTIGLRHHDTDVTIMLILPLEYSKFTKILVNVTYISLLFWIPQFE